MEAPITSRLVLRPLLPEDAGALFALTSDYRVARFMRFSTQRDPADAARLLREYTAPGNASFALLCRDTGSFAGVFIFQAGGTAGEYGLSLMLSPSLWARGIAAELLEALLPYAGEELGARVLTAHVLESNLPSRRVLTKNGFAVEAVLHFPDCPDGLLVYRRSLDKSPLKGVRFP